MSQPNANTAHSHSFNSRPNRTVVVLTLPVMLALIAEPITGVVDTAFIAQLGTDPLAALGVGTAALSTIFWIFNFLGISTQTEVARALGREDRQRGAQITGLALLMGVGFSVALIAVFFPGAGLMSTLLGADGAVRDFAVEYLRVRMLGAPAVLIMFICFGALRGLQDVRITLWIAASINALNILLNAVLIFGLGPVPALGITGAALASAISQWIGAAWALLVVQRRLGLIPHMDRADASNLLRVGGDLFVRTGLLTLFILVSTRVANQIGPEAGAAHQAIRTVWLFLSLMMEGFAMTAQSLVGYFLGAGLPPIARRAAAVSLQWGLGTGVLMLALMLVGGSLVVDILVPEEALGVFWTAWFIAALTQPLSALAFVTDGIHWGTSDYGFLRNAMIVATCSGVLALMLIDTTASVAFTQVWLATWIWLAVRAGLGVVRVWPGIGRSPLRITAG